MATAASQSEANLQANSIKSIANVSRLLREAIGAALPVAPEQYLTIAIPGTVIDTSDIDQGGTYVYNMEANAFPPLAVQQAEANLVDGMMPLANVMIGNTGKSVARSYARALDGLLPKKATMTTGDAIRSPGDPAYDKAMEYLTSVNNKTGKTPIQSYVIKQANWARAWEEWQAAKQRAQKEAEAKYPAGSSTSYLSRQVQFYNEWNQLNYLRYKSSVQGRWMDWVTEGDKYNVEYNFGMVDVDSIMARIEASKESIRNSTIVDADGSNEVHTVVLTPKNWATLCKGQAEGWYSEYGYYSLAQIDAEIARLTQLQMSYSAMKGLADSNDFPTTSAATAPEATKPDDLTAKMTALYKAQATLNNLTYASTPPTTDARKSAEDVVTAAEVALQTEQDKFHQNSRMDNAYKMARLDGTNKQAVDTWIDKVVSTINSQIQSLGSLRDQKLKSNPMAFQVVESAAESTGPDGTTKSARAVIATSDSEYAKEVFGISRDGSGTTTSTALVPAPAANAGSSVAAAPPANPWTKISCSYSASDQQTSASTSSWGMSVGGSVGWGLWSVGGNYSHDQTSSDMQSDMANCDVSINFSALVVNINRPWLYGELFNDFELDVAADVIISPGPELLQRYIQNQVVGLLGQYSEFPSYPTSFIVAANTVMEFSGSTQHIQQHFDSQSNSGGISVGYGPWSVSSSFHQSSSNQSCQMEQTATGVKLLFSAPQVIGWVSQILPALPRNAKFNPLTQGAGIAVGQ